MSVSTVLYKLGVMPNCHFHLFLALEVTSLCNHENLRYPSHAIICLHVSFHSDIVCVYILVYEYIVLALYAIMMGSCFFQQSSSVVCRKLDPQLDAVMVVVILLMWKPHQMKMMNHHERKVEIICQERVDNVAHMAEAVNVVEAVEVASVEEVADVAKEADVAEVASMEEVAKMANDKVLVKVMNCSGCMERYNILLKASISSQPSSFYLFMWPHFTH